MDIAAMNVLVGYATRNGSTKQVAETIAETLLAHGAAAEIRPLRQLRGPVAGKDLIIIGAPIYSGRWHNDAHRFLKRHRTELRSIPVAVFGMGPRTEAEDAWQRSRAQLDRALAKRDWLQPVAVAVFGGVDPPGRHDERRRDVRDWDAIRAWAMDVALGDQSPLPGGQVTEAGS